MKIYTRTGDKGTTMLIGGSRVAKHDLRIETYGTVDELNSHIGLVADVADDNETKKLLLEIQDRLFIIGSHLAAEPGKSKMKLPDINAEDLSALEKAIDRMNDSLPEMKFFILPGGHVHVSYCHIARCVCRRAERKVTRLAEQSEVDPLIVTYLNRLSDYLFVLARFTGSRLGIEEKPWKTR